MIETGILDRYDQKLANMNREALEKLLTRGQDSALLRYTLGTLCIKEGLLEKAVEHLERALDQDSNHSATWKSYAKTLAELERKEEAVDAYQKGIRVADSNGDIQAAKEMRVFLKRLSK
jgi:uncharacterized protein HemY